MDETVEPIGTTHGPDPVSPHATSGYVPAPRRRGVSGHVIGVHRGPTHHDAEHRLDVSVGAEERTELVVQVESGSCEGFDGKRVVVLLDE